MLSHHFPLLIGFPEEGCRVAGETESFSRAGKTYGELIATLPVLTHLNAWAFRYEVINPMMGTVLHVPASVKLPC